MDQGLSLLKLKENGHKITIVRKEVVGIFADTNIPLSAREVLKYLKVKNINVNPSTVYRELIFLKKEKLIIEIQIKPNEKSYESASLMHHHHLICNICGSVSNVTNCLAKNLDNNVLKNKGFKIENHVLEFYGICKNCRSKNK